MSRPPPGSICPASSGPCSTNADASSSTTAKQTAIIWNAALTPPVPNHDVGHWRHQHGAQAVYAGGQPSGQPPLVREQLDRIIHRTAVHRPHAKPHQQSKAHDQAAQSGCPAAQQQPRHKQHASHLDQPAHLNAAVKPASGDHAEGAGDVIHRKDDAQVAGAVGSSAESGKPLGQRPGKYAPRIS